MLFRPLIFIFFFICNAFGTLILEDGISTYDKFTVEYLQDFDNNLTIKEVAQAHFTDKCPSQFTLGYNDKPVWFKITIENRSQITDFILLFRETMWTSFDLYEEVSPGEWLVSHNGLDTPLKERGVQDPFPSFELEIQTGMTKTFYLYAQTYNAQIGAFKLFTHDAYDSPIRFSLNVFYLLYTAFLILILLFNIFLFIQMRRIINFYYIAYIVSFMVFISMFSSSYLIWEIPGWDSGLHVVGTLVMSFMALFSLELLQIKRNFPKIYYIIYLFIGSFLIMGILIALHYPYVTLIFNLSSATLILALAILAVISLKQQLLETKYYLIALIVYMPSMGLMVLDFNTLLPNNDFTRFTFLAGAMVEIILFTLILASRYHTERFDEIRLNRELLKEKQKNQEFLENEIVRMRQEINEQNAIMMQQSRYASMGEMIGNIAHQWRQPLSALSLTIGNLEDAFEYGELTSERMNESSKKAYMLIEKMSNTIDDFRNFFKPNKEKKLFSVLDAVCHSYNIIDVPFKSMEIKTHIDIDPDIKIFGYENEFSQVILNFFNNSKDAFEERNIADRHINIKVEKHEKEIILTFEDNAGGIPPEYLARVFDPYFSTKEEGKGTGIGLYMSKSIIEGHHEGVLKAENTQHGVCFTVTFFLEP